MTDSKVALVTGGGEHRQIRPYLQPFLLRCNLPTSDNEDDR